MQRRSVFSLLGLALGALADRLQGGARSAAAAADIPQDAAGMPVPGTGWRIVHNVALLRLDDGAAVYGALAGPRSMIADVFDRGVQLRRVSETRPPAGCYAIDGRGAVHLGAPASGWVTADVWVAEGQRAHAWVMFDAHLAAAATPERRALLRAQGLLFPDRETYLAHLRARRSEDA